MCECALTSTFVDDGHFEWYADNSHQVLGRHQRAQNGANTQSFAFPLVDELEERNRSKNREDLSEKSCTILENVHASLGRNVPKGQ